MLCAAATGSQPRGRRRKPLSSADGECDPHASLAAAAQLRNEKRTLLPNPWPEAHVLVEGTWANL